MLLIGVNRSPYTRRVAITLKAYGLPYAQQTLSGFDNRSDVRGANPLGRIPALVLGDGETLVDSAAIIDHLDEVHGRDRALTPPSGADRRAVQRVAALMMGACDKGLHAAYERNHHPPEKVHQPWIDDCMAQMKMALGAVEAMVEPAQSYLLLGHLTQADITAFIAERLARGLKVDTAAEMPRLRALCAKLLEQDAFRSTEP
jgi:glutathione S-transferase